MKSCQPKKICNRPVGSCSNRPITRPIFCFMDEDLMIMGKLIYIIATVLDIKFVVNTVNQFMHAPRISHIDHLIQIFIDLKISIT